MRPLDRLPLSAWQLTIIDQLKAVRGHVCHHTLPDVCAREYRRRRRGVAPSTRCLGSEKPLATALMTLCGGWANLGGLLGSRFSRTRRRKLGKPFKPLS